MLIGKNIYAFWVISGNTVAFMTEIKIFELDGDFMPVILFFFYKFRITVGQCDFQFGVQLSFLMLNMKSFCRQGTGVVYYFLHKLL